ncbi:MAG TPA: hypothetical protein VFA41_18145 [Ktedonobacteraceae bacterium]|nr:hypothetical protein [Ktedonobacteraceae bacterium]
MSQKGRITLIVVIVCAAIGAAIGYALGRSVFLAVVGAVGGVMLAGVLVQMTTMSEDAWLGMLELGQLAECCLSGLFVSLTSITMVAGFLLWHSRWLAFVAGLLLALYIGLPVVARLLRKASAKRASML